MRGKSLINFLVNNSYGTIFLKFINALYAVKDTDMSFQLLDDVVEEVGEYLVVQIVTDNTLAYKLVEQWLMKKKKHIY